MNKKSIIIVIVVGIVLLLSFGMLVLNNRPKSVETAEATSTQPNVEKINRGGRKYVVADDAARGDAKSDTSLYLSEPNDEEVILYEKLKEMLHSGDEESIDEALIEGNSAFESKLLLDFVGEVLTLGNTDYSFQALNMITSYGNVEKIDILSKALKGPMDDFMIKSILESISYLGEPEPGTRLVGDEIEKHQAEYEASLTLDNIDKLKEIIAYGLNFNDDDVNSTAFDLIDTLPIDAQMEMYNNLMLSGKPGQQLEIMEKISTSPNVDTMLLSLEGFANEDPDIQEQARLNLIDYVDKDFENAAEAVAWWNAHKHEYADDLSLINAATDDEE